MKIIPAEILNVYESISHCSGGTGIPKQVLRKAKQAGCPAFDGNGRVRLKPLLAWLFKQPDGDIDYHAEWKKWQALREKMKHDKDAGTVADKNEVRTWVRSFMALLFGELDRIWCMEMPPTLKGLSEAEMAAKGRAAIAELKEALRAKFQEQIADAKGQ